MDNNMQRISATVGKVHPYLQTASDWVLRILIIVAGVWTLGILIAKFDEVTVPVLIAILITAILQTPVRKLMQLGLSKLTASILSLLITVALFSGIVTFVVFQIMQDYDPLYNQLVSTTNNVQNWLIDGPLHLNQEQISGFSDNIKNYLSDHKSIITDGAIYILQAIKSFATGLVLTLFTVIFLLHDGEKIWNYCTKIVPVPYRLTVRTAGNAGFKSLEHYGRTSVIVAAVDAIGIGAGLFILNIPIAGALASLVFVGAFIPIVGALVTGFLAVFIALITKGFVAALLVLGITILVMQLESHVLQPFLMGKSVNIHPLAIVLLIGIGVEQAGIIGGLLVVPIAAFMNSFLKFLAQENKSEPTESDNNQSETADSDIAISE